MLGEDSCAPGCGIYSFNVPIIEWDVSDNYCSTESTEVMKSALNGNNGNAGFSLLMVESILRLG